VSVPAKPKREREKRMSGVITFEVSLKKYQTITSIIQGSEELPLLHTYFISSQQWGVNQYLVICSELRVKNCTNICILSFLSDFWKQWEELVIAHSI
jgi:hypothetical protein